ncbi:hypothetical protein D3C76_1274020 [compost metagenome]
MSSRVPNCPLRPPPKVPNVVPWLNSMTLRVSPLPSTSVSLLSTLPLGLSPGRSLFRPPASVARLMSGRATGVSSRPTMVMLRLARSSAPLASITV